MRATFISGLYLLAVVQGGCGDAGLGPREKAPAHVIDATPEFEATHEAAPGAKPDSSSPVSTAPVPAMDSPPAGRAGSVEAIVGSERDPRKPKPPQDTGPQSGILTAGSFDDNLDPQFFRKFLTTISQNPGVSDFPGRVLGQRLTILVKDQGEKPLGNARVRLGAAGGPGVELTTRTDGRAIFLSSWDQFPADRDLTVTVTPADGSPAVTKTVPKGSERQEIVLPSARAEPAQHLDLALVLDTTGSMGDELDYLKSEIKSIASAVHEKFPQVKQRYALVLYRDEGDEYVIRSFDFTGSIDEFHKRLSDQRAGGGGDEPEAMHKGLEEVNQMRWREDNAARVLFLVADAPPHTQFIGRTMTGVDGLRKKGIAVYPVACSGYSPAAEVVMRGSALLTGGQFLFLTNDSGVGNPHAEPHIPFYHVEKLDKLMIRMIASELSGKRIAPEKQNIIRTVGQPIN